MVLFSASLRSVQLFVRTLLCAKEPYKVRDLRECNTHADGLPLLLFHYPAARVRILVLCGDIWMGAATNRIAAVVGWNGMGGRRCTT